MSKPKLPSQSESDVNDSARRAQWQSAHLNDETNALLERDPAAFFHQCVSMPCQNAIAKAEGLWIEDTAGRFKTHSFWDSFHGAGFGAMQIGMCKHGALRTGT